MKKLAAGALILCMMAGCAMADPESFVEDYNLFAPALFGIPEIEIVYSDETLMACRSETVELMITENSVEVFSEDPLEAVSAACCSLRCIDNLASMIDQYGRVLHACFLCRVSEKEGTAVTANGIRITVCNNNGIWSVKLEK